MCDKRKRIIDVIFYASVLSFLLIFFIQLHPLFIFDGDDWWYIQPTRSFLPNIRAWNPARILPEILMPAVANIGAFVINPLRNDYIWSLAISFGIFVSVCIVIYCFVFEKFINNKFEISKGVSLLITGLFLAFHFWIFRSKRFGNIHLLFSGNVTCYFYYTLSTILNAVLVMILDCNRRLTNLFYNGDWVKKSFLCLAIYLAVFSNLFASVVLCAYSGTMLLCEIIKQSAQLRQGGGRFLEILRTNCTHVIVIAFWLISALLETQGGRARQINSNSSSGDKLRLTKAISHLYKFMKTMNKGCFVVSLITVIVALIIFFASQNKTAQDMTYIKTLIKYTSCVVVTAAYIILLSAKIGPSYASRADTFITIAFFAFLSVFISLAYICQKVPASILLLPLLACYVIVDTDTSGKTFRDINNYVSKPEIAYSLSSDIVKQVTDADKNGESEVEVYVPKYKHSQNWPIATFAQGRIAGALYQHGLTSKLIKIYVCPDETLNEMYGVN